MYKIPAPRRVFLSLLLIIALSLAACGQSPAEVAPPPEPEVTAPVVPEPKLPEPPEPAPPAEPEPVQVIEPDIIPGGPYAGSFAFSNINGSKLMILPDASHSVGKAPESLDVAIGPGGTILKLKYSGTQEGTGDPGDYMRPSSQNFEAMFGHVYEVTDGKVERDTPYFVTSSYLFAKSMTPIKAMTQLEYSEKPTPAARSSAIKKREDEKGLSVIHSETLATVGSGGYLELFQYERVGNDMLFEIVYDDGTREISAGFPAEYNEYSTWRADAGDSPGLWIPLFFCDVNDNTVMSTLWAGPEGGNIAVWFDRDGTWIKDEYLSTYWYWG